MPGGLSGQFGNLIELEYVVLARLPPFHLPLQLWIKLHHLVEFNAVAAYLPILNKLFKERESLPKLGEEQFWVLVKPHPHLKGLAEVHAVKAFNVQLRQALVDRVFEPRWMHGPQELLTSSFLIFMNAFNNSVHQCFITTSLLWFPFFHLQGFEAAEFCVSLCDYFAVAVVHSYDEIFWS